MDAFQKSAYGRHEVDGEALDFLRQEEGRLEAKEETKQRSDERAAFVEGKRHAHHATPRLRGALIEPLAPPLRTEARHSAGPVSPPSTALRRGKPRTARPGFARRCARAAP